MYYFNFLRHNLPGLIGIGLTNLLKYGEDQSSCSHTFQGACLLKGRFDFNCPMIGTSLLRLSKNYTTPLKPNSQQYVRTHFPSLAIFVNKKVGIPKN